MYWKANDGFKQNDMRIDDIEKNVVLIRRADFSWGDENKHALTIDHLNIPASKRPPRYIKFYLINRFAAFE